MHSPEKQEEVETTKEELPEKIEEPTKKEDPKEDSDDQEESMSLADLDQKFSQIKDEGNAEYKAKSYVMAASKFTEGINLYLKNEILCRSN